MAKQSETTKVGIGEGFNRGWLPGLVLVFAVFLTYLPVWHAGFIWDDDGYVNVNSYVVGPMGLSDIWTTRTGEICPLTKATFWLEHRLWGLAPLPDHVVNVLLHGACAVLLWRVLRSLQVPGAWLGAALWALHPLQVETVAWVSELKNTQSSVFFLLSILFFVRLLKARNLDGQAGAGWNYTLTVLFAALALASKTSTVVLPVVLCLCAWWVEGLWRWRNLVKVAPIFLMSVAAGAILMWTQSRQKPIDLPWIRSWPERVAVSGDVIWFYLGKLVWPHPLMASYPTWEINTGWWVSYLPLLAAIIVLFVLWLNRETWSRPCFFVFAYFVVALLPVLGLVTMSSVAHSLVADHLQYLAGMGPLALAGAGMVWLADFVVPGKGRLQSCLCAGLLLVLGIVSWQRTWVFGNATSLWIDTLAKDPTNWVGYHNLGLALADKGRMDEAISQFQTALKINPNDAGAYNDLGSALLKKGRMNEATVQFQKALEINPNYGRAHYNLGLVFLLKGEMDEAIEQFQKAVKIDPDFADAHNNLGVALIQKGQVNAAIVQFREYVRLKPDNSEAQASLAKAEAMAR